MLVTGIIGLLQGQLNGTDQSAYANGIAAVVAALSRDENTGLPSVYEDVLPRGYALPAIAVHVYGGDQGYDMAGPDSFSESQLQLDVYGADSVTCREAATAARQLLKRYLGTLPDGTVVTGLFQERDMAMPFLPKVDAKAKGSRWTIGFRVISNQM